MWFTETPWPPIFICTLAAAVLLITWFSTQRAKFLLVAAGLLAVDVGIFSLERIIVTEAERVEQFIYDVTSAFQQRDLEKTLSFFAEDNTHDRALVRAAMNLVKVEDDMRITDMIVTLDREKAEAKSHFRANASVTVGRNYVGWKPSRWVFTWRKTEDGEWKITEVVRMNPVREEEMQPLEQRVE